MELLTFHGIKNQICLFKIRPSPLQLNNKAAYCLFEKNKRQNEPTRYGLKNARIANRIYTYIDGMLVFTHLSLFHVISYPHFLRKSSSNLSIYKDPHWRGLVPTRGYATDNIYTFWLPVVNALFFSLHPVDVWSSKTTRHCTNSQWK